MLPLVFKPIMAFISSAPFFFSLSKKSTEIILAEKQTLTACLDFFLFALPFLVYFGGIRDFKEKPHPCSVIDTLRTVLVLLAIIYSAVQ